MCVPNVEIGLCPKLKCVRIKVISSMSYAVLTHLKRNITFFAEFSSVVIGTITLETTISLICAGSPLAEGGRAGSF